MQHRFLNLLVLFLLQEHSQGFAPAAKFGVFVKHSSSSSATLFAGAGTTLIGSGDIANKTSSVVDKVASATAGKKKDSKKKEDSKKEEKDESVTVAVKETKEETEIPADDLIVEADEPDEQTLLDIKMMKKAIKMAQSR